MVHLRQPLEKMGVPSISERVHAADWHERETEDLFGLAFEGHPKLGEFVLHEEWPDGVNPMRRGFDAGQPLAMRELDPKWQPETIVEARAPSPCRSGRSFPILPRPRISCSRPSART